MSYAFNECDYGGDMAYDYPPMMTYLDNFTETKSHIPAEKKRYVIVCDSPHDGHLLYLQDRRISNTGYWTNFKDNARIFDENAKSFANSIINRLKFNNPRLIPYS